VRAFSDYETLRVWETGLAQHPVDRALTILAAALPETDRDRLASMSIGIRDGCLMDARQASFGAGVSGVAECPGCGELLEWALDLGEIRTDRDGAGEGGPNELCVKDYELSYRLPDSTDLATLAHIEEVAAGRAMLLRRCVLEARRGGARIEPTSLPEEIVRELADEMEMRDPQAETLLDFECPECGSRWQTHFDVLAFLWAEIQARAQRLLGEVHSLARAYGWSEAEILGMSVVRRRFYLESTT
jgi:hypothetical protein